LFAQAGAGGGTGGGGAPSGYLVVDYNSDGSIREAFLPEVGRIAGSSAGLELQLALEMTFSPTEAAVLLDIVDGDGADAAEGMRLLSGSNSETGFALISTAGLSLIGASTVEDPNSASTTMEEIVINLGQDGYSYGAASAAARAFALGKVTGGKKIGSIVSQDYIYIETADGDIYYPSNGQDFVDTIDKIDNDGDTITEIVIKGHGGPELIQIGDEGDILIVSNGHVIIGNMNDPNIQHDITEDLNDVTDANTDIDLKGCSTSELASDLNDALGGAPDVSGAPIPIIGIPWTSWTIGPWYTY